MLVSGRVNYFRGPFFCRSEALQVEMYKGPKDVEIKDKSHRTHETGTPHMYLNDCIVDFVSYM